MRNLQWGSRGEDVKIVQQRLCDLGYYHLAIDGIFGAGTRAATMAFQRDNGLVVDGIVGPNTYAKLGIGATTPTPGPTPTPVPAGRAVSLHIGVNSVDPGQYAGWDGKLGGCENDAHTMQAIADAEGFSSSRLLTASATSAAVLGAISSSAQSLVAGDTFLLTYAGHGGQVPNTSADNEVDQQDETWVLFDRMLIDDELEQAFSAFRAGVNIILLSDSCHSGTVYRDMFDPTQLEFAELKRAFYEDLAIPRDVPGSAAFPRPARMLSRGITDDDQWSRQRALYTRAFAAVDARAAMRTAPSARSVPLMRVPGRVLGGGQGGVLGGGQGERMPAPSQGQLTPSAGSRSGTAGAVAVRAMPLGTNAAVLQERGYLYSGIQEETRSRGAVAASGLSISGCKDAQLSQETGGHGVFTTAVKTVWANNAFTGDYSTFHKAILTRMGPTQTPELNLFGASTNSLLQKTPFNA